MHPDSYAAALDALDKLKAYRTPEYVGNRLQWAVELQDLLYHRGETSPVSEILQDLIDKVIPKEPDEQVRDELFRALENGIHSSNVDIDVNGLADLAATQSPAFLCRVLDLLASRGDDRQIDLVRANLNSSNKIIRDLAQRAWDYRYADVERRLNEEQGK